MSKSKNLVDHPLQSSENRRDDLSTDISPSYKLLFNSNFSLIQKRKVLMDLLPKNVQVPDWVVSNPIHRFASKKVKSLKTKYGREWRYIKRNKWPLLVVASLSNLVITLIPLKILLTLALLALGFYKLVLTKMQTALDRGLITYMPLFLQRILLQRSILDLLCDFWFIPNVIQKYGKTVILPLFDKSLKPEEAGKTIEHLDPKVKKVFMRKGLAFLGPKWITKALLPNKKMKHFVKNRIKEIDGSTLSAGKFDDDSEHDESSLIDIMEDLNVIRPSAKINLIARREIDHSEDDYYHTDSSEDDSEIKSAKEIIVLEKPPLELASSDKKVLPKEIYTILPTEEDLHTFSKNSSTRKEENQNQFGDFKDPQKSSKTKIIISGDLIKEMKDAPGRVDPLWDGLEVYRKGKTSMDSPTLKLPTNKKLEILNLIMNLRDGKFISEVENKTLYSIGGISLAAVALQLIMSRKARKWTKNLLQMLLYASGSSLVVVSIILIVYKLKAPQINPTKNSKKK